MTETTTPQNNVLRTVIIAGLVVAAFFGAYRFASAGNGRKAQAARTQAATAANPNAQGQTGTAGGSCCGGGGASSGASAGAGGCCGSSGAATANGVTGNPVKATAQMAGGIQVASVQVTTSYSPNIIKLKAGVPAEITFSQAAGCTSQVVSEDLGFSEDLSAGPRTVKLDGLAKGTYAFHCGMGMVFGQIVVE
jgi:hypothetical protein